MHKQQDAINNSLLSDQPLKSSLLGQQGLFKIGIFNCIKKLGKGATSDVYLSRVELESGVPPLPLKQGFPNQTQPRSEKEEQKAYNKADQEDIGQASQKELKEEQKTDAGFQNDQLVVLKIFRSRLSESFKNELSVYRRLEHPNLLKCYGYYQSLDFKNYKGIEMKLNCLILEYAENGELFGFLESGQLSEDAQRFYFRELLKAVHYMHSRGFAHYDLKPENIFLDADFMLKVGDFGASYELSKQMKRKVGTKVYQAPEYHQGEHFSGVSADYFALGVILFILGSGRMPYLEPIETDPFFKHFYKQRTDLFWQTHIEFCKKRGLPHSFTPTFMDLVTNLIEPNPRLRIQAADTIGHAWTQEQQKGIDKSFNSIKGEMMLKKKL